MKKKYKVGDRVKTIELGEGTIEEVNYSKDYYYKVVNGKHCESYTKDWKNYEHNAYSSLVEDEEMSHPVIIGRWMLVSDDKTEWRKRFVIKTVGNNIKQSYLVFSNTENEEQLVYADDTTTFDYVKEIESELKEKIKSPEEQIGTMFNEVLKGEEENDYRGGKSRR